MKTLRALVAAGIVVASFGVALAKLPPPAPLTEEQKKAAEEKKAKDAVAAEAAKAAQARAEDRVAAKYYGDMKAQGKQVPAPQMAPASPAPAAGAPAKTSAAPSMAVKASTQPVKK
jgi:hypothetical protein